MSAKKRVYELAKELGIDNKELIARLAGMGIVVKTHSSTLEDSEVERVKREFLASQPHELVEKRVKATVIRRRAVRVAEEQAAPAGAQTAPAEAAPAPPAEEEPPAEVKVPEPPVTPPPVKKAVPEAPPPVKGAAPTPRPAPQEPPPPVRQKLIEPVLKIVPTPPLPEKKVPPPAAPPRREETAAGPEPVREKEPAKEKVPTPPAVEVTPPPARKETVAKVAAEAPVTAPKRPPKAPELKVVKEVTPAPAKKPTRWEIEREKRKGKKPVEVVIAEPGPAKKKLLVKKVLEKKDRIEDLEREDRPSRWREEKKAAKMLKTLITTPKAIKRRIKVGETITVGDLAKKMGVKAGEVINKLMGLGLMVTINQSVDYDTASLIAADFGYQVEQADFELEETLLQADTAPRNLRPRAPVVTVMGHVDHGKTSLLDAIRRTNVIDGEAGGITQAIGAYHVRINERDIVFLDTPGHEAFTAMRARGAQVTDIVVLVVAADDGVMDQTVEAINHARAAGVPIMVAINKIDKPNADPERIKQALTEYNLVPEEWGGDTIFCEVSAKQKINIEELLELILLQADVLELKADPDRPARGVVIEAKLDKGRGPVATVLIQEGTLKEGDTFVCKTEYGRVRAMIDDKGRRVKTAGPSMPVEVIGFSRVPQVSAEFLAVEDEKKARNIADYWVRKEREKELSATSKITLEQLYARIKEGVKDFNVIIKGDVQGSIEAITEALNKLSTSDVRLKIIHSSTGTVTETDVMLASSANAIIIGFNVRPEGRVVELAQQEGVEIKLYDIIYNVVADVKAAMEGLLEPEYKEVVQGRAEVRQLFRVPKVGTVAGCYVTDGKIPRGANLKLVRDGVVVHDGRIASLKRLKDDVREVAAGFECGIGIENFNDIREGDVIEAYVKERVERKLQ
ncbi:MAG TPA: translation initiation factor IF-2 [Syntrophales bacterium]|nr:translation initiation factor IF-2 [Syntrophales bacterium]HOM06312.1 translation initiation factor IF-2 [Syntrophales bacterium]HPQ05707.1 translation initiation factor IF-2 [Syntrophales bacterium]